MDIYLLVTVPTYKSREVAAMNSSEQFRLSRPCNTIVLAARKIDSLSVVKFELWAAESQIFLSLTSFAFDNFEK